MRIITLVALLTLCGAAMTLSSPVGAQRSSETRALDAAVMSAITRGDINHARRLAVTAEHWIWIDQAQSESPQRSRSGYGAARSSPGCASAQRSYQIESGRIKKNLAAIDAKREAAMAACGSAWY